MDISTKEINLSQIVQQLCRSDRLVKNVLQFRQALGLEETASWMELYSGFSKGNVTAFKLIDASLTEWMRSRVGPTLMEDLGKVLEDIGEFGSLGDLGNCTSFKIVFEMEPPGFNKLNISEQSNVLAELRQHRLNRLEDSWKPGQNTRYQVRNISTEIRNQTESLPIMFVKDALIKAVQKNQVLVVVGEAGSGKSTQIPKYLGEAGFGEHGLIGFTQPRRLAAKSLAERVSAECGTAVGELVGYAIRFEKRMCSDTVLKFMTDGLLVREFVMNSDLSNYSVLIIDEAHERTKYTDVCFGLLKSILEKNTNLKVIIRKLGRSQVFEIF